MLSAGVPLLRGITGHCHAYETLGIDTSGSGGWSPEGSGYGSSEGSRYGSPAGSRYESSEGPGYASSEGSSYGSSERPGSGASDHPHEERFGPRVADEGLHEPGVDRTEPYPRG